MADPSKSPVFLNTIFDEGVRDQFDPIHLTDPEILPILQLPLAGTLLGHDSPEDALSRVSRGEISFTQFVADKAQATSQPQDRSQLLHIGVAALFSFLQSNVTGPPLEFSPAEVILPLGLRSDPTVLQNVRAHIIRELSVDGEAAYKLTPNVELFAVAKALLADSDVLFTNPPLVARTARMRVNFLHQKMLSEVTGKLQDAIYEDLEKISQVVLPNTTSTEAKGRFLLERATIHTHHGYDAKARADLEQAAAVRNFEFALTGRMGKRTKFQDRDISQLVILAKSANEASNAPISAEKEDSKPKNLDLNDDTLLESISFSKSDSQEQDKPVTVQDESDLSPSLASLDPGNQPILNPIDSSILLAVASAITNTTPENGLTREETQPYATRVLEGGSSNWQIYTQALLLRSRIEGYRARTVERSVLQMQALVDQVIADTATPDTQATGSVEQPTTFLPRPEQSESATAAERLEYIWILNFSTRWNLESELAKRWVELGALRTALEIYERLQMWAEAALCYAATEREAKAKSMVRRQLYEPIDKEADDENEKFEGPERSPLPADAPRLFCILGDIDTDPAMYERAWEVSGHRYARAQRSLARHYLTMKPPALEKAEEAYRKSLHINRLNHSAWFALGCVQLELQRWEDAIDSFTRTVQIDDTDAEAWSNLAAAILRSPQPDEDTTPAAAAIVPKLPDEDEEVDENAQKAPETPWKRKREALAALHRAASLKHTDARIWDNVLTVAASIPPPFTPFRDAVMAQRRLIELLGAKNGEKCVDIPILGMLVDHLVTAYDYDKLLIHVNAGSDAAPEYVVRSGTVPGQILSLIDDSVVPLITHSAPLWLLVSRVEQFREQPSKAFEAHEKAWRATVASSTQGAFQMGDEKKWMDVVRATEKLVRNGYAKYGPMDKEGQGDVEEPEQVAKDWRFKSRSAVRGILGKGKDFWEDTEGWTRLKELQSEVGSS
ncbi:tetratricopeptide repeat domain protein [Aspergillus steynii IBT 23096]|uniref:Tetratricopeptide repeat domain protein n=1 Tax=Aspergillus steynii IBT 23096 TaxID=1392250 RepID=A0A2I2FZM7_9EURO|nr:tetratricopeptide repeat domain protein [Aspergillus steynii IBT 23096]PLB46092.1 tetratricopeptide repeat domain protein [Aspergillus steynii IBT 23096]